MRSELVAMGRKLTCVLSMVAYKLGTFITNRSHPHGGFGTRGMWCSDIGKAISSTQVANTTYLLFSKKIA